mmetsp:Transcript_3537/g.7784  ORF Transcript_3537/g.7784 Transcript_3537/m.7784 type:complete len:426 (+) Transcript_3537:173-1450(+)
MMHQQHAIILLAAALASTTATVHGSLQSRRLDGLGKWQDGPETEIDCSKSPYDYSYYIEKCLDTITQWWIHGRCINGKKEEVSELHRCMKPDGTRPNCHDCKGENGGVKNVCGSDGADSEEVCKIAWESTAEGCGDMGLTVYSHQCAARPGNGGTDHWYLRESFYCDEEEVYESGTLGGNSRQVFTCGKEWYYPFEDNDPLVEAANPSLVGVEHAFAFQTDKYCLDCGLGIQVCSTDMKATCNDHGLPERGEEGMTIESADPTPPAVDTTESPVTTTVIPETTEMPATTTVMPETTEMPAATTEKPETTEIPKVEWDTEPGNPPEVDWDTETKDTEESVSNDEDTEEAEVTEETEVTEVTEETEASEDTEESEDEAEDDTEDDPEDNAVGELDGAQALSSASLHSSRWAAAAGAIVGGTLISVFI